jgi:hypothetical protein
MVVGKMLVAAITTAAVTAEAPSTDVTSGYLWDDNKSWAVTSHELKEPFMQTMYDHFMEDCRHESKSLNYDPVSYCDDDGMFDICRQSD